MWLTILCEQQTPDVLPLGGAGTFVIGRAPDCDIVVDDPSVSARHARLRLVDHQRAKLTDLHSTNGTYVDDDRVVSSTEVGAGSSFRLGAVTVSLTASRPMAMASAGRARSEAAPPTPAAPSYDVRHAGPVAGRDVQMSGHRVAGRDLVVNEGFKLQTKFRESAKNCIRLGCALFLAGFGTFGYFVLQWNTSLFGALDQPLPTIPDDPGAGFPGDFFAQPDLPSATPWLPLGLTLCFAGIVLVVVGLLMPRERILTAPGH